MNPQPLFTLDDLLFIVPKLLENLPVTLGITLASLLLGPGAWAGGGGPTV
nr:ABC-type amino acid transport system [Raoultella sp. NCTC 9187]